MPSAKAILIQSAVIVGLGAAIGLGDLVYRGGGVKASLGESGGHEKIDEILNRKPAPNGAGEPGNGAAERQPDTTTPKPAGTGDEAPDGAHASKPVEATPPVPAATVDCTSLEPDPKWNWPEGHITVAKAAALFESGQVVFVDARIEQEYLEGHVPGAHFLPVSAFEGGFPDRVMYQMDPHAVTIVYCSGGKDCEAAEDVAVELQAAGFTALRILHDGMPGWVECGHPVETGEDPHAL